MQQVKTIRNLVKAVHSASSEEHADADELGERHGLGTWRTHSMAYILLQTWFVVLCSMVNLPVPWLL